MSGTFYEFMKKDGLFRSITLLAMKIAYVGVLSMVMLSVHFFIVFGIKRSNLSVFIFSLFNYHVQ